jgi:hypothetical protein
MAKTATSTWTKATVKFMHADPPIYNLAEYPGWLSGNIGIVRLPDFKSYDLVHQPSGLGMGQVWRLRDARQLVADLRARFPELQQTLDALANKTEFDFGQMIQIKSFIRNRMSEVNK